MKNVILTTDGACHPNPGPGGWAVVLRFGDQASELSGGVSHSTNNRMEIHAIVEGLRSLKEPCEVLIRTDSQIAMSWCQGGRFATERHRLQHPEAYASHLEFKELAKIHRVTFQWVKGHAGDPDNERADVLAEAACRRAGGLSAAPVPGAVVVSDSPPALPPAAPGMIRLTHENLHALSGSALASGFTRKQLELLGVSWPPPKGWLAYLIGREISQSVYEEAKEAIAAKWKRQRDQGSLGL